MRNNQITLEKIVEYAPSMNNYKWLLSLLVEHVSAIQERHEVRLAEVTKFFKCLSNIRFVFNFWIGHKFDFNVKENIVVNL